MKNATRQSLIDEVAAQGHPEEYCRAVLNSMCDVIVDAMGGAVPGEEMNMEIRGFGRFFSRIRKAKPAARNPKTGEICYVPRRRVMLWRPYPELRLQVNSARAAQEGQSNALPH